MCEILTHDVIGSEVLWLQKGKVQGTRPVLASFGASGMSRRSARPATATATRSPSIAALPSFILHLNLSRLGAQLHSSKTHCGLQLALLRIVNSCVDHKRGLSASPISRARCVGQGANDRGRVRQQRRSSSCHRHQVAVESHRPDISPSTGRQTPQQVRAEIDWQDGERSCWMSGGTMLFRHRHRRPQRIVLQRLLGFNGCKSSLMTLDIK